MECLPQIHIAAAHSESGYNTEVAGLGVLCTKQDYSIGTGFYRNSEPTDPRKISYYVFAGWQPIKINNLSLGLFGGIANNYSAYDNKFGPIGGFAITQPVSFGALHYLYIPKTKYSPDTLQLSITVRF